MLLGKSSSKLQYHYIVQCSGSIKPKLHYTDLLRICCRLVVDLLYNKQMDSRSLGLHSINYMHNRINVSLLENKKPRCR